MNIINKNTIAIGAIFISIFFTSCNDTAYVEKYVSLDSTNSLLQYADTTVIIKWVKSTSIIVAKPDSVYVLPNYPYVIALDTIIGVDDSGASVPNIYKKTSVDTSTGEIRLNNGTSLFKIGTYEIYVGFLTENGFVKFRDKPIRLNIVP